MTGGSRQPRAVQRAGEVVDVLGEREGLDVREPEVAEPREGSVAVGRQLVAHRVELDGESGVGHAGR